ncbi:MAG: glycosyltransferase [Rubrivivax sp.]|nr:glycosyltransferase [Rubrivivax sp.]
MSVERLVSIIAPCRNERAHIDAFCADALAQQLPAGWRLELCIADGSSDDGTRERLVALAAAEPRLRWIDNPGRIVSTGLNRALAAARGEVIVRMDIHTAYAADYVAQCLAALAQTGADNVGGPWRAEPAPGAGPMAQAVAAAFQSAWVAGGAASRRLAHAGWVDTVYLGCWPRATFERFGGFDETLVRNQDDEHNLRIRRGGGRIWQSPLIRSRYRPRGTLRQVFSQWFQYGYWKPFVIVKHRQPASLRHLVPAAFVGLLALSAVLAGLGGAVWPLLALVTAYAGAVFALSATVAVSAQLPLAVAARVPAVIAAYHLGYGLGSWPGWLDALRRRPGRSRFGALTR